MKNNLDKKTVDGFGDEWSRFDQSGMSHDERSEIFSQYFAVFPWDLINSASVGFDLGCGSGRWAMNVAPKVETLHCIDPSKAIDVARKNLNSLDNVVFHQKSVSELPFSDSSMDFGYSLGVLHHIPDTQKGVEQCVNKLKTGAPFLLYLYYAFDNQPRWYRWLWKISDAIRKLISILPHSLRYLASQGFAFSVYLPLARLALLFDNFGLDTKSFPLSAYKDKSVYTMRTDALDRFGTRLEQRFTKAQIQYMMEHSGLKDIKFSDSVPYWCAVGIKK